MFASFPTAASTMLLLLFSDSSSTTAALQPSPSWSSVGSRRSTADTLNKNKLPTTVPTAMVTSRHTFVKGIAFAAFATTLKPPSRNNVANAAVVPTVYEGMQAFGLNQVETSIEIYDSIIRDNPKRKPYLWQRGLSLYYAGRYEDGADQFETDVAVNPNDTEEQIWHLLCLSKQIDGSLEKARTKRLTVGKDRRPVMKLVQKMFLGDDSSGSFGGDDAERTLIKFAINERNNSVAGDQFYASLYLSLYYESLKDEKLSEQYMVNAVGTEYARSIGRRDPMVDVAKIAMQRHGWSTK